MEQTQHSSTGENQGNLVDVPSVSHPDGRRSALPRETGSVSAGHFFVSSIVTDAEACGDQALSHGWTRVCLIYLALPCSWKHVPADSVLMYLCNVLTGK